MKTVFLLGAGASWEAGLPLSSGLVDKTLEWAKSNDRFNSFIGPTVRWAHRQMLRKRQSDSELNIETLINILDLASNYDRLPVSATVNTMTRQARRANRNYAREFLIRRVRLDAPDGDRNVFGFVARLIRKQLQSWLTITDKENSRYIVPLLEYCQRTGSSIVSLNYDNVIETASELCNITVDDGMNEWTKFRQLTFDESAIPLVKLHGSLNWIQRSELLEGGPKRRQTIAKCDFSDTRDRKSILIFGGQNKLSYEPPFPDLYAKFRSLVIESECVSNIGYGGLDPHVNQVLEDWAFAKDERLYSEATNYGEAYSKIFTIGPFHRLDTIEESLARPKETVYGNRTLGLLYNEWPRAKEGHTATYLQNLDRMIDGSESVVK